MKKRIQISYFPKGMIYSSPLLLFAAIFLDVEGHIVWGIILKILSLLLITTRYITVVDLKQKKYADYLSCLFIPLNKQTGTFESIKKIIVTKENNAQTINTRAQSRQLNWSDYTGTLIFNKGNLDLLTKSDKQELLKALHEWSKEFNVGVEDQTTSEYFWLIPPPETTASV